VLSDDLRRCTEKMLVLIHLAEIKHQT